MATQLSLEICVFSDQELNDNMKMLQRADRPYVTISLMLWLLHQESAYATSTHVVA